MRVVGAYAPPPPPGAGSPIAWGDAAHLRALLGEGVRDLESHVGLLHVARFATAEQAAAFFLASFPPAVALMGRLPEDRAGALRGDVLRWAEAAVRTGALELEYVLTVARRA